MTYGTLTKSNLHFLMCKIYVQKFCVTPSWLKGSTFQKFVYHGYCLPMVSHFDQAKKVLPTTLLPRYLSKNKVSLVYSVKIDWAAHFWHVCVYIKIYRHHIQLLFKYGAFERSNLFKLHSQKRGGQTQKFMFPNCSVSRALACCQLSSSKGTVQ